MESAGASPFVMVLTPLAVLAAVYAFICEVRQDRIARRVRDWARETYPEVWGRLPWFHRRALAPRITLRMLLRQRLIADRALVERYSPIARLERRKLAALAIGAICIALILLGTGVWGWSW
jgi:hypothetical protein